MPMFTAAPWHRATLHAMPQGVPPFSSSQLRTKRNGSVARRVLVDGNSLGVAPRLDGKRVDGREVARHEKVGGQNAPGGANNAQAVSGHGRAAVRPAQKKKATTGQKQRTTC